MREKKNVIVVMLDTLQFNYLGCYGNTRVKTPNIDRFATEGVVFENAYTEGLPTVPCRRAMLTGRYTLPVKGWSQLDVSDTTIADLCWGQPIDSYLIHDPGRSDCPSSGTRGASTRCSSCTGMRPITSITRRTNSAAASRPRTTMKIM